MEIIPVISRIIQTKVNPYWPAQNTPASTPFGFLSGIDSKIHSSVPSSLIWLHQRKPTNILYKQNKSFLKLLIFYLPSSEIFGYPEIKNTHDNSNNENKSGIWSEKS